MGCHFLLQGIVPTQGESGLLQGLWLSEEPELYLVGVGSLGRFQAEMWSPGQVL